MAGTDQNLCFVCSGALANGDSNWRSRKTGAAVLENNLDVIFLLRKLVQVPSIQLEGQLKESGDNPQGWISRCDQCTKLIKKARELDEEIQKIEKQLRSIQKQVWGKIRAGGLRTTDDKFKGDEEGNLRNSSWDFQNKIRSFVKNHQSSEPQKNEEVEHGVLEGDKLAKYLESHGNFGTAAIVLVEKPGEDEQDEIKVEQESPASSPAAGSAPDHFSEEDDPSIGPDENEVETTAKMNDWSCSVCGKKFNSQSGMYRHVLVIHKKRFRENCPLCKKGFESKKYLHRHLLGKHKDDPFTMKLKEETGLFLRKCSVVGCGVSFMKQVEEDRHMERIHGGMEQSNDKRYKCKYCGRGFWDGGKCRRHEKIHETKGKVRNVYGKAGSKVEEELGDDDEGVKCDLCGITYKNARYWSDHLWKEHGKMDITCPGTGCGRIFNDNLVEFQDHWKSSHEVARNQEEIESEVKHLCSFCGKEFNKRKSMLAHQRTKHVAKEGKPESEEKFICEICGVEKKSRSNLSQHKRTAHGKRKPEVKRKDKQLSSEKPFICGTCGKGFISQASLWHHKTKFHRLGRNDLPVRSRRKNGEKASLSTFLCNLCGKEFRLKGYLNNHVRFVHDKQYSLSCYVCGLKFTNKIQLNMHLLGRHREDPVARQLEEEEGLKLIKCEVVGCNKRFLKQEGLDRHVERFHKAGGGDGDKEETEKRFKCKYCEKGFWKKVKLIRHERIHEGKGREDWKCELCGKGFSTKDYLYYHLLMTHKKAKKFREKDLKESVG